MKGEKLRQETYKECRKGQRRETMMALTLIAGTGILFGYALIPVYFWLGCGLGLFFVAPACLFAHAIWKRYRAELDELAQGILAEAEVVEAKEEQDSNGRPETLAVHEFVLPGGSGHRFKESVSSPMAGILGQIWMNVKHPVFVDRDSPDIFYLMKRRLTGQPVMDMDSPAISPYLEKLGKGLDRPESGQIVTGHKLSRRRILGVSIGFFIAGALEGIGFVLYHNCGMYAIYPRKLPQTLERVCR